MRNRNFLLLRQATTAQNIFRRACLLGFLFLGLSGCYDNTGPVAQAPSPEEIAARRIIAHADRYCRESHYEPGTAHFDDCVKDKAIADALEEKLLQQIASARAPAPLPTQSQVYVATPSNTGCVPDVRGMSAGAAFAAGLRGC